jgi:hypothetical protein
VLAKYLAILNPSPDGVRHPDFNGSPGNEERLWP